MKFNIGDRVKLLNQTGEGVITKIKNSTTVIVLTGDDFELPFMIHELLKIEEPKTYSEKIFQQSYHKEDGTGLDTSKFSGRNFSPSMDEVPQEGPQESHDFETISPLHKGFVSKNPQKEGIYLAFVPHDQHWLLKGAIDLYIINYTSYTILYSLLLKGDELFLGSDYASIPAFSKSFVSSIEREDIGLWSEGIFQCLFTKEEEKHCLMPLHEPFKLKTQSYLQDTNYIYPIFLREKALIIDLMCLSTFEADHRLLAKTQIASKAECLTQESFLAKYMLDKKTAQVDLHIEALIPYQELKNKQESEYFPIQMAYFKRCLSEAMANKLEKIIFIHGVGIGHLKQSIIKEIKNYEGLHFFEASSLKYGAGALEVYIK